MGTDRPPRKAARGEAQEFLVWALTIASDDCVPWPFARMGPGGHQSGAVKFHGQKVGVHRIICFATHGDPPTEFHEAAHSCGHGLCINPNHIRWNLPKEITAGQLDRGTFPTGEEHANAKLDMAEVCEIRELRGSATETEIAAAYGIGRQQVHRIIANEAWRHLLEGHGH